MTMIEYPRLKKIARQQPTFTAFMSEVRKNLFKYEVRLWKIPDYERFYNRFQEANASTSEALQ